MKKLVTLFLCHNLLFLQAGFSEETTQKVKESSPEYSINELTLPSEVKNIGKTSGAIYYSPSVKNKVLIPVHIWGEVTKSGLHFLPVDTTLVNGVSMAGGPKGEGLLEEVKLTRNEGGKNTVTYFNLSNGGDSKAHDFKLKPGDTIFFQKDNYLSNRSYYTSLIGVIATFLSTILLYREVRKNR